MEINPPRKAILLARLSDNRDDLDLTDEGIPQGLDDQIRRMREKAEDLGWTVHKVIQNPRLSAYKKRKVELPNGEHVYRVWRPDLREALSDLATGRANALLALDLDRAFRDPGDLQDLINVVEHSPHSIVVESVTGSLHMEKGRDNFDAEIRVLVANKSSRDTARRVSAARERQALNGKFGGGRRPYGFGVQTGVDPKTDKPIIDYTKVVEDEAKQIKAWADDVLAGVPLRTIARQLRDNGVPTVTDTGYDRWQSTTVRDILLRPRNAGLMVYKGKVVGAAPWEPILERDTWETIVAALTDPDRAKGKPGRAPRYLGTGIYLCQCGQSVVIQCGGTGKVPGYRCGTIGEGHIRRKAANVDELVQQKVVARLSGSQALKLLDTPADDGIDVSKLRTERKELEEKKKRLIAMHVRGDIDDADLIESRKLIVARLDELRAQMDAQNHHKPWVRAGLPVGESRKKLAQAWVGVPLGLKREIIKELVTVTILRSGQRGRIFDRSTVVVRPRQMT